MLVCMTEHMDRLKKYFRTAIDKTRLYHVLYAYINKYRFTLVKVHISIVIDEAS